MAGEPPLRVETGRAMKGTVPAYSELASCEVYSI